MTPADEPKAPPDPERTVFMPSGASAPPAAPKSDTPPPSSAAEDAWFSGADAGPDAPAPAGSAPAPQAPAGWDDVGAAPTAASPAGWDEPRSSSSWQDPAPPAAASSGPADPAPPSASSWNDPPPAPPPAWTPPPPPAASTPPSSAGERSDGTAGRIAIGMVLNHIYEVRRFIARGGMGEVYEGVNVNTDERVAIKVILSHLALDPNVVSMFRKEARTLTRLSHPALVQYRVLAQEPTLGVLYIVTEFIDGQQLGDVIGKVTPTADELEGLMRRLASGLDAAHALGAIHRDMAPDNVLLPSGRLDQATIIDFGIAKDLDPSNKPIVGDGFAGKLGFVAPEQFGDYNREVGPWTDVYSLALVLLAVANGKPVDMGSTLVEAIDKRRAGPDLAAVPDQLKPVFAGMLRPNPTERFRSMSEVLQALDRASGVATSGERRDATTPPTGVAVQAAKSGSPVGLIVAGLGGVAIVAAVAAFLLLGKHGGVVQTAQSTAAPAAAPAASRGSEQVRQAVEAALPAISCSWIDIDDVSDGPGGVVVKVSGVAGALPAAQKALADAAHSVGTNIDSIDSSNVFPISAKTCAELDAFRSFREPNSATGRRFVSSQSNWELLKSNPPCDGPNAKAVVNIKIGDPNQDFSIVGMDKEGALQQIFPNRAAFDDFRKQYPELASDTGNDSYSSTSCYNETGLVGELLVTGAGPFDQGLPDAMKTNRGMAVDQAWLSTFASMARAKGWKTNMVWYRVVNDQAG